jgi:predicted metal-dependent phosphoesterase TrpH
MERTKGADTFRAVAHPFRYEPTHGNFIFLSGLPLEGLEVASSNIGENDGRMAHELAEARGFVKIAGSDAHSIEMIGRHYTIFEDPIRNIEDLVHALRQGRCHAHAGTSIAGL